MLAALHVEERADQVVALDAPARAAGQELRAPLEEERRARPAGHGALEIGHVARRRCAGAARSSQPRPIGSRIQRPRSLAKRICGRRWRLVR